MLPSMGCATRSTMCRAVNVFIVVRSLMLHIFSARCLPLHMHRTTGVSSTTSFRAFGRASLWSNTAATEKNVVPPAANLQSASLNSLTVFLCCYFFMLLITQLLLTRCSVCFGWLRTTQKAEPWDCVYNCGLAAVSCGLIDACTSIGSNGGCIGGCSGGRALKSYMVPQCQMTAGSAGSALQLGTTSSGSLACNVHVLSIAERMKSEPAVLGVVTQQMSLVVPGALQLWRMMVWPR